jgi:hypothetical protein
MVSFPIESDFAESLTAEASVTEPSRTAYTVLPQDGGLEDALEVFRKAGWEVLELEVWRNNTVQYRLSWGKCSLLLLTRLDWGVCSCV